MLIESHRRGDSNEHKQHIFYKDLTKMSFINKYHQVRTLSLLLQYMDQRLQLKIKVGFVFSTSTTEDEDCTIYKLVYVMKTRTFFISGSCSMLLDSGER